jgi:hypothetical protein
MAHNRTTAGASLLLRDLRNPAEPMRSFTVKLPGTLIDALDQHAAAHKAPRSTLARTLLAQGVEQLESAS